MRALCRWLWASERLSARRLVGVGVEVCFRFRFVIRFRLGLAPWMFFDVWFPDVLHAVATAAPGGRGRAPVLAVAAGPVTFQLESVRAASGDVGRAVLHLLHDVLETVQPLLVLLVLPVGVRVRVSCRVAGRLGRPFVLQ